MKLGPVVALASAAWIIVAGLATGFFRVIAQFVRASSNAPPDREAPMFRDLSDAQYQMAVEAWERSASGVWRVAVEDLINASQIVLGPPLFMAVIGLGLLAFRRTRRS